MLVISYKINNKTKLAIYKTLVKPILIYSCSTWGLTNAEESKFDAFHRKQLRRVLGIKYPTIISNKKLYKKTGEEPVSLTAKKVDGGYWDTYSEETNKYRLIRQ